MKAEFEAFADERFAHPVRIWPEVKVMIHDFEAIYELAEQCSIALSLQRWALFESMAGELRAHAVSAASRGQITNDEMFDLIKNINTFSQDRIPKAIQEVLVKNCNCRKR